MTPEKFNELANNTVREVLRKLDVKSIEYSRSGDKLHNFKRAGNISNEIPEKALMGMLTKHITSIYDIVDDINIGKLPKMDTFIEKSTDTIAYLMLLEGLIKERLDEKEVKETRLKN